MEELESAISCVTTGELTWIQCLFKSYTCTETGKNRILIENKIKMISFYAQSRGLLPHQIRQLVCHIGCCQKKGIFILEYLGGVKVAYYRSMV